MSIEPRSLSAAGAVHEENRRGLEPESDDADAPQRPPFLSRRFVIGSLVAFGILVGNALLTYRVIANLIEASRVAESTLKVVEALKDVQDDVTDSQIELRGYIISGERERLERARGFLERAAMPVETLRALSEAIPDQAHQVELLRSEIAEELARFDALIATHRRGGVAATLRGIRETAGQATIHRAQLLTAELQGASDARLARRTEQARRSSDLSVITAAVSTLLNVGLLGLLILLARREIKERLETEEVVRFAATHDPLTGLPNRLLLAERANRAIAAAKGGGRGVGLLFVDLDRFKNINDALGHEAGDRLLQNVAGRVARCVRRSDTIARHGGDEFVVLIEGFLDRRDLAQVAEKILAEVSKPMTVYGKEFQITASVGISVSPADGEDLRSLLKNADIAMYRAKQQGRNAAQYYVSGMNPDSVERLELEAALRHALERNELSLYYQPKVEARSGRVTGIECLLRWQHPTAGLVLPDQLVPLAEETGLIVPIGQWALREACLQAQKWVAQGLPMFRMAVNLSARQFMSATLLDDVSRIIKEAGMDPRWIELEVTESVMMPEPDEAVKLLRHLKAMGVRVTIDDFGTGYSSLAYLKRLPIDCVKIDGSFIRGIPVDASDVAITETILAMASSLGLKVVAEGVETRDQVRFLERRGCDEMQGFHFSKPLPAEELTAYLEERGAQVEESRRREGPGRLRIVSSGDLRVPD